MDQHTGLIVDTIREDKGRSRRALEDIERMKKEGVKIEKEPIAVYLYRFKTFKPSPGCKVLVPLRGSGGR